MRREFPEYALPEWDEEKRTLTLLLSKGRIARLRYSYFVDPKHLGSFGILRWAIEGPENQGAVWVSSALGCYWMLTPFRNLTLVRATQAPVCLPELRHLTLSRKLGNQTAQVNCRIVRLQGPLTAKFEIKPEWEEWIDDLNDPDGPKRVTKRGQLGEIQLEENHLSEFILSRAVEAQNVDLANRPRARQDIHEIGDTKFHLIRYTVRASTRFREYLPPSIYADSDLVARLGPVAEGPPFTLPPAEDAGAPVLRDADGTRGQSLVHASMAPDDPRVLYIVPPFRWLESKGTNSNDKTRLGNGLHVWLDRPWFSSGDGELLGVVLFGEGMSLDQIPEEKQGLVTQSGQDPLWVSSNLKSVTRANDFPARVAQEDVRLQEAPADAAVRIVGHRVRRDNDRKLWYADIELNPDNIYMPVVRLALVRFQPNALAEQKISKVVLAEFSQVLPHRRARLNRGDATQLRLYGPTL